MAAAAAQTTTDVKRILKRMTTAYDRVHARAIGKFSYSAPTALWSVILPQITSYQNMKTTVVESARYLSDFGWDVTIFMLLDALTDEAKTAVKQDGTSASTWLIGVAAFIGQLAKRYSAMNLHPFFQLILNQLSRDNLSGLITFKHIISAMGGIDPLNNVSPDQVKCFSGGPVLYTEGVEATRAEYPEPPRAMPERIAMAGQKPQRKQTNTKSRTRLLSSLESSGLIVPLLVAICQTRRTCIFTASAGDHNKQLVTSMDECHAICNQFIRFLHNTMSKEKYAQFVPTLKQLRKDYGLDIAMTYQLTRPKLHWQLYTREEYLRLRLRKYRKDLSSAEEHLATWDDSDWQAPLWPIMVDTAQFLPEDILSSHLVPFHVTFWQLGLGEISCPEDMYGQVIKRLKDVARDLEEWAKPGVALDTDWSSAYRANRAAILAKIHALTAEQEEQIRIANEANIRIEKEAGKWFPGTSLFDANIK
jgi:THO complex subunit 2